jgi:hypothetical protein
MLRLFLLALLANTPVTIDGMSATPPADWKSEPVTSSMRRAQFSLPHVAGEDRDAELAIFFFGEGMGGDAQANVERWKTLFQDAKPPKVTDFKVKNVKVTYFDISGTYLFKARPVDPELTAEKRPNHRMLAVVWESPHGPYFMRLVGPEKTVTKYKTAFDAWLKSFK